MEYYKVIGDINELKYFYDNVLVKPEFGESIMICHSARAKKLSEEEKKTLCLGRSEMFHTEISKKRIDEEYTWIDFLSLVSKLEVNKTAYLTKNKLPYPDTSLVSYIYMNPCSEAKCAQDTLNRINVINQDLISSAISGSANGVSDSVGKLSTISNHIKSCHAQNPSRKIWIDIDIDCEFTGNEAIKPIKETTLSYFKEEDFFMIRTVGGVHILLKRSALKFNPNDFCKAIETALQGYSLFPSEIKKNDNCMIPIPGTYQYGKIVRVIK